MNVLIVGAGKSGTFLAEKLRANHQVTIIESEPARAASLGRSMPGVRMLRGDGCEPSMLDKAGITSCDMVAALTGDDEDNLVVSFLSKNTHRVPMVFARINHPSNEWMFTKRWGVDVPVSAVTMIYDLVEKEMSPSRLVTVMGLRSEETVIDEITIGAAMKVAGKAIKDVGLPRRTSVMVIVSHGEVIAPKGGTVLNVGDEVVLLSHRSEEDELRRLFDQDA